MARISDPTTISGRAVQEAVKSDAELATSARALAQRAIAIANEYLDSGSPQMRLSVIKAIMPAVGRGLSEKGEDETITELREQLRILHEAVLGQTVA